MIKGTGIDIVSIKRIEKAFQRYGMRFLEKIYTNNEISYCLAKTPPFERLAGRFAAKESVLKALGYGWSSGITFKSVEILSGNMSEPVVILHNTALNIADDFLSGTIHISITHDNEIAAAIAVIEKSD